MKTDNQDYEPGIRTSVISSTFELFAQYGIKSISMDEVARNIGMSKRTLYTYFDNKEDLLIACLQYNFHRMNLMVRDIETTSDNVLDLVLNVYKAMIPRLRSYSARFFEDMRRYPRANKLFNDQQAEKNSSLLEFFQTGVSQGVFISTVNYEIFSKILLRQIESSMDPSIVENCTMAEIQATLMHAFLRGICTSESIHTFDEVMNNNRF